MTVADLIREATEAGAAIRLDGAQVKVAGATPELLARLREHKPELVAFLHAARETTDQLLEAAMRACDHWGDSETAREAMRQQCLEVPLHQRADWRDHFIKTYPKD